MNESAKNFCAMFARLVLGLTALVPGLQYTISAFDGNGIAPLIRRFAAEGLPMPEVTAWIAACLLVTAGLALLVGALHKMAAAIVAVAALCGLWFYFDTASLDAVTHQLVRLGLALSVAAFGPGMFAFRIKASEQKDG